MRCEDHISLSMSFACLHLSQCFAVCACVYDFVSFLVAFKLHCASFLSAEIAVYCNIKTVGKMNVLIRDARQAILVLYIQY